ncbi:MAG: response regulator [Minisyncoccales bacterium]
MKKILIVEDDNFLSDIYKMKLERLGFSVNVAEEGSVALKKLKKETFDLILLDIVLPQLNGWQILEFLRNDPRLKNTKVIVLSNLFEKKDFERGVKFGVEKYFVKAETTPDDVVEGIKNALQ